MTDPTAGSWWGWRRSTARSCPMAPMPWRRGERQRPAQHAGRVTSTYYSPTLGKGIAMGLVLHGPDRMGEVIEFNTTSERSVKGKEPKTVTARIVSPVFYDPEGEKQNV
jgi:sarcosine oxidase subunit alpha